MREPLTPRSEEYIASLGTRLSDDDDPPDPASAGDAGDAGALSEQWKKDRRTRWEKDRDRIVYCGALQRLGYVTQVTAPESGHIFHNRLSHSLKVAQIGRRNAQRIREIAANGHLTGAAGAVALSVNADAVEAACLAHDLGHPPFGHIAEEVLQQEASVYMPDGDGFEGNAQSFRIVTRHAQRATAGGLDLTRQTLNGVLKYPWRHWSEDPRKEREHKWGYYVTDYDAYHFARAGNPLVDGGPTPEENHVTVPPKSIEAWIMEWADDLTYAVHDVDDFFRAGLIPLHRFLPVRVTKGDREDDEVKRLRELLLEAKAETPQAFRKMDVDEVVQNIQKVAIGAAPTGAFRHRAEDRRDMRAFGSELITRYVDAFSLENEADGRPVLKIEEDAEREVAALKMLVRVYVIRRPGLAVVQHGQQRVMRELFRFYYDRSERDPKQGGDRRVFPAGAKRVLDDGPNEASDRARVVVDYLSGLTETVAVELHRRLVGGSAPTLDATAHVG